MNDGRDGNGDGPGCEAVQSRFGGKLNKASTFFVFVNRRYMTKRGKETFKSVKTTREDYKTGLSTHPLKRLMDINNNN